MCLFGLAFELVLSVSLQSTQTCGSLFFNLKVLISLISVTQGRPVVVQLTPLSVQ